MRLLRYSLLGMPKKLQEEHQGDIDCLVCGVATKYLVLSKFKGFDHSTNEWLDALFICHTCRFSEEDRPEGTIYEWNMSMDMLKDILKK